MLELFLIQATHQKTEEEFRSLYDFHCILSGVWATLISFQAL